MRRHDAQTCLQTLGRNQLFERLGELYENVTLDIAKPTRAKKIVLWSVTILLAMAFLMLGTFKLAIAEPLF